MAKKNKREDSGRESEASPLSQPLGVKLVRTLRGHEDRIGRIAWSPNGRMLASPSEDHTIRLWDTDTGACLRTLRGHADAVNSVAFDPTSQILASGSDDHNVMVWEANSGRVLHTLKGHVRSVLSVAFDLTRPILNSGSWDETVRQWDVSSGKMVRELQGHRGDVLGVAIDPKRPILASCSYDRAIKLWDSTDGHLMRTLEGHMSWISGIAFDPTGNILASGSDDKTIRLWEVSSGKLLRTLEGHTGTLTSVSFLSDGTVIASQGRAPDNTIRLWSLETGNTLLVIPELTGQWKSGLSFHPFLPLLATVGSDTDNYTVGNSDEHAIHIWELDLTALRGQTPTIQNSHYVNAKVVLLGDTGVGKSGLSLVLNGEPYKETDSTPGRKVWTFSSHEVELSNKLKQTRETLLWDMAGQPGYRVIHQLHLNEVAVALVVFDSRSETDPLAGVRHWERALRLAQQRQGSSSIPMKKFLVSARSDRGTVSVSKERLETLLKEFEFEEYFETSAKEGWKIKELRHAIEQAISWHALPEVSSSLLFSEIKAFLLEVKETGRLVARAGQLYDEFARAHADEVVQEPNLRDQFDTCISRLENRDLIRQLSFGGYVLLQPELLDAYASAMVNAAKKEPDGLGSIAEDIALAGQFYVPDEQKVMDRGQEQLLLHATVEELVRHDLALRESATDGRYLVFPSEFIRDYEAAPEPKGKALALTFDGPVQSLYSTLAVRLGHSGLFTTGRAEMWRNAAVFTAKAGGKCGLYLHEFAEARGRLVIFYDQHEGQSPSDETRFHFEEFVVTHAQRHAINGTVDLVRFFVCANCGDPVPDSYVKRTRERGVKAFGCPCGATVSLAEPKEKLRFTSRVEAMEKSADRQRDFEMFVESARGETSTPGFTEWAGDDRVTLAIVFTDVVGSTALGQQLGDTRMNELRRAHFVQSRDLIKTYKGREIKTIGDSFMAAFRSVGKALDYAMTLQANPGAEQIAVRAGIHIGAMQVEENDVFGGTVNFAARVVSAITGPEIWLSNQAKDDLDAGGAKQHAQLNWKRQVGVQMKGFKRTSTLWSLEN